MREWIAKHLTEEEKLHYKDTLKAVSNRGNMLPLDVLDTAASKKDKVFSDHESLVSWVKSHSYRRDRGEGPRCIRHQQVAHDTCSSITRQGKKFGASR